MSRNTFEAKGESRLTSEQVDAITYAHMDIKAVNKMLDSRREPSDDTFSSPSYKAKEELFEATKQTTKDLEKAFPFLIEEVEGE